ncbi:MAG: hypothetical protein IK066_07545 [Kiritimatiellae bacterium]|nr:hypothetical protein [Kiritimatiellia bacterium]
MTRFAPRFRRPARALAAAALAAFSVLFAACEEFGNEGSVSDDQLNGRNAVAETADGEAATATDPGIAIDGSSAAGTRSADSATNTSDSSGSSGSGASGTPNTSTEIGGISWKGKNVSGWPVTANLRASVSGSTVTLSYDKSRAWPAVDGVCANCWAIVNIGGKWYAGTFEYLRPGQNSKPAGTLSGAAGDHFKVSPLSSWRPQSGEVFGLMVSGLCRGGLSNVQERSNIVMVRWP